MGDRTSRPAALIIVLGNYRCSGSWRTSCSKRIVQLRSPRSIEHRLSFKSPQLVARHGGNDHQLKSVRPIDCSPSGFQPLVTVRLVRSLEEAMLKALPSLFPNLLGTTSSPRVDFYDKFQREADEHDRDFTKKYDDDLNTTLIFVSVFPHPSKSWR